MSPALPLDHPLYLGLVECMLFCGVDVEGESEPNSSFSINDLAVETIQHLLFDCADFMTQAGTLLEDLDLKIVGQDFFYDREGHGTGFRDRISDPDRAEALAKLAETFGQCNPYESNGLIYLLPDKPREFEWGDIVLLRTPVPELPRYRW